MNLQDFVNEKNLSIEEVKTFLRGKGKILFSQTFPMPDDVIQLLNAEYASDLLGDDGVSNGVNQHSGLEEKNAQTTNHMINTDEFESLFGKPLRSYIKEGYHIVIDTCSILREPHAFEWFYKICKPLLVEHKKVLEVPYSVYAELAKFKSNPKTDHKLMKLAEYGMELIKTELKEGCITIIGDREDKTTNRAGEKTYFADPFFTEQILSWINKNESVLLITQDMGLTKSVLRLQCVPGSSVEAVGEIVVRKLDQIGRLVDTENLNSK